MKYSRKQIHEALNYWRRQLRLKNRRMTNESREPLMDRGFAIFAKEPNGLKTPVAPVDFDGLMLNPDLYTDKGFYQKLKNAVSHFAHDTVEYLDPYSGENVKCTVFYSSVDAQAIMRIAGLGDGGGGQAAHMNMYIESYLNGNPRAADEAYGLLESCDFGIYKLVSGDGIWTMPVKRDLSMLEPASKMDTLDEAEGDAVTADELTRMLAVSLAQTEPDPVKQQELYRIFSNANMHVGTIYKSAIGDVQSYEITGDSVMLVVKRTKLRTPATGCMKAGAVLQVLSENPEKRVYAVEKYEMPPNMPARFRKHDDVYPIRRGDCGARSGFWLRV